ncbi:MAG: DUF4878 domain-containing protein [Verrucomicrobiota bacterium]
MNRLPINASASDADSDREASADFSGQSPADVVLACLIAINAGQHSDLEKYLAPDALEVARTELADSLRQQQGTIESFKVIHEELHGDRALVTARIQFIDGTVEPGDQTALIRTGSGWKITTHVVEAPAPFSS